MPVSTYFDTNFPGVCIFDTYMLITDDEGLLGALTNTTPMLSIYDGMIYFDPASYSDEMEGSIWKLKATTTNEVLVTFDIDTVEQYQPLTNHDSTTLATNALDGD